MRHLAAALAMLACPSLLAACANPQATLQSLAYGDPAKPYLGMTRAEITACAGMPHSRYASGENAETFTYRYKGAGPAPGAPAKPEKKKSGLFSIKKEASEDWTCTASLVFEDDRLVRVSFAHKDVRSPYAWQSEHNPEKAEKLREQEVPSCSFSLPNCQSRR
jgi:hypothetical protein